MMVNPHVLGEFWMPIVILSLLVIVGKFIFGVMGMLVGGQPLRIALQSGLALPQSANSHSSSPRSACRSE